MHTNTFGAIMLQTNLKGVRHVVHDEPSDNRNLTGPPLPHLWGPRRLA